MTPTPDLGAARRLHAALQRELSFVPEILAFLDEATRERLEPLRRFRHVVRNIYGMRLDPDRARELAGTVGPALQAFSENLARFDAFLAALCGATTPPKQDAGSG